MEEPGSLENPIPSGKCNLDLNRARLGRRGRDSGPSSMRRPAGCLGQEEALFQIEQRNPALASLPDQALVIAVGIVSGKRKMKAVLTVRFSMATSCVATQPRQDGNDIARKVPRTILARLLSRGSTLIRATTSCLRSRP